MHLMIDLKTKPTAYLPIPVPIHWQDDVKAGLDRDIRLGVIEPVPVDEPVTWCHRMVICAKKNGKHQLTSNHSTFMQLRKLIIPSPFPSSQISPSWKEENSI